ncbi:MAG: LruC domain-containing protein [Prevotella sp.]|nr:LruC domain-containing protein [Prevotella sp.]
MKRMKYLFSPFVAFFLFLFACSTEEATEFERTNAAFLDSLGGNVSSTQWWRTAVKLSVTITTDDSVKLVLLSSQGNRTVLYDYKEVAASGTVTMTAPQGQGNTLYLRYFYKGKQKTQNITLSGKSVEHVSLTTTTATMRHGARHVANPPSSLCGNSIGRNAKYYQFSNAQLYDFFAWMSTNVERVDAKEVVGQVCNYELVSNGPFYITWVTGNEAEQRSHILGYYYHSSTTYDDIVYVDLSETHKWDYIDGLAKVQYQIAKDERIGGQTFYANTWYDANFDMSDLFGATTCYNMDRVGDDAFNMHGIYNHYGTDISALRGISFKIDVPEGMRVGFYLRSDEEPLPEQWTLLRSKGVRPYVSNQDAFMGTCFCAEFMNVEGNGRGKHRSFIKDYDEVYWMGMEDLLDGGDHDCNDVIFGVEADLKIWMPDIIDPKLANEDPDPEPDPEPEPVGDDYNLFPWTVAYEDVNRNPDFDFNDAVIKLVPDYENELCCVTVMAAGSTAKMYLHYDGPYGDVNMGEIHDLLGCRQTYVNTKSALAGTPFVLIDCVPWPKGYTMAEDAKRFYIEIQRGTCTDCTDVITLAHEPGQMPEAVLVAGEWQWPMEGKHIFDAYGDFSRWAQDETRTRFWEWYKTPELDSFVTY